jgi:hypothetical protein
MGDSPGQRRWRVGATEQRVFGIPLSWWGGGTIKRDRLAHPIRWARWRRQVARLGPYAPRFEDFEPGA